MLHTLPPHLTLAQIRVWLPVISLCGHPSASVAWAPWPWEFWCTHLHTVGVQLMLGDWSSEPLCFCSHPSSLRGSGAPGQKNIRVRQELRPLSGAWGQCVRTPAIPAPTGNIVGPGARYWWEKIRSTPSLSMVKCLVFLSLNSLTCKMGGLVASALFQGWSNLK